jgi:bifunctional oligoribonuclease and PAP phosphatase NrnA
MNTPPHPPPPPPAPPPPPPPLPPPPPPASSILISSHVNPDGDAIGSILGTALTLAAAGKRVLAVNPDPVPWTFQKLPQAASVRTWSALPEFGRPDLWLALDTADEARLGLPPERPGQLGGVPVVQFDHHVTNTRYGCHNVIEPTAAACCEQMTHFLANAGFVITADAATCLLCGLVTDSGSFRFTSVSADTFRAAASLVEAGAGPGTVGQLLSVRRFASAKLWGLVLSTLELEVGGRIVIAQVTRSMFDAVGLGEEGTEGLVEAIRTIEGVDVAILLREEPSGEIKVSVRTNEAVDATVLAVANGGGGHPRAAGCTVPGPLAAARRRLVDQTVHLLAAGTLDA